MAELKKIERLFLKILSEVLHDREKAGEPSHALHDDEKAGEPSHALYDGERPGVLSRAAAMIKKSEHRDEIISRLLGISKQQKILPMTYDFLCRWDIDIPDGYTAFINREISGYALTYFQNVYFTDRICRLLDRAEVPYALLKGMQLGNLYPNPMYRRFGDIDIYAGDKAAFKKIGDILEKDGFSRRPSSGDHHYEYILKKKDRLYLIELHQNLISSQEDPALNRKIEQMYHGMELKGVLPVTYDALYLLLHMLQHLLDAGFGIKLLCDWVVYLEQKTGEIDADKLKELLETLDIFPFAETMTNFCIEYLGLKRYPDCFYHDQSEKGRNALKSLAEDIFSGGEFGENDASRMIIMKGQFHLKDYFLELHRQTKKNFPVLWKTIVCLPFLWCFSGIQFLYNNKKVRHTDVKKIMETTKKRQQLLHDLEIKL